MTDAGHTSEAPTRGRLGQLASVWKLLSLARRPQRRSLAMAIACGVMASLADIASLALLKPAIGAVGVGSAISPRASLAMFIIAAMVASIFRLAAIRQTVSTQYGMASSLAVASFERPQKQDYSAFLKDGASPGFAAFDRLYTLSFQVLAPTIAALTAACSILVLLAGLAVIEPWAAVFFAVLVVAVVGESRRQVMPWLERPLSLSTDQNLPVRIRQHTRCCDRSIGEAAADTALWRR